MTSCRQLLTAATAVVLLLGGCGDGDPRPASATSSEVSATSSAVSATSSEVSATSPEVGATSAGVGATSAVEWVAGLPVGRPPAVGYVIGHSYHSADGRVVRLLRDHGVTSVVRLGDGYLVTSDQYFEGTTGLYRLDGHGEVLASGTVASPPVLGADGRTVHWLTFTPPETGLSRPTLLHEGDVTSGATSATEVDVAPDFLTSVVGAVDGAVVVRTGWGGRSGTWVRTTTGRLRRARLLDGAALLHPGSGLVAVRRGRDDQSLAVVDLASHDLRWRAAATYPVAFSPSGRRLLAYQGRRLVVLDARTGRLSRVVPRPACRRGTWLSEQLTWEDERHLLAGVDLRRRTAVVRIDVVTGQVATAVDWTDARPGYGVVFETVH